MDLFADDGLWRGLWVSAAVAVPLGVALVIAVRRGHRPLPVAGAAAIAASLVALRGSEAIDAPVIAGVLLAGAGGLLGAGMRLPAPVRVLLVVPGAVLAVLGVEDAEPWMVVAAVLAVATAGPAADTVDRRFRWTGLGVAMLCVSTAGVFVTVPETDVIIIVLGAMVPIGFLAAPMALASLGPGGASAMLALLATLALDGGWVRPGAIVGALLAPGLLALLVAVPSPPPAAVDRSWPPIARILAMMQIGLVLVVTRIAGLMESAGAALAIAAVAMAVAFFMAQRVVAAAATGTFTGVITLVRHSFHYPHRGSRSRRGGT